MVLFSMGGLFALYEGIEKLRHPHEVESLGVAVVILLVAIVLESFSLRTAIHESRKLKPAKASWRSFIRRTKQPELPVVLLEDIGALIGLVFALFGVVMSVVTDNPRLDALGSVAIGVLLVAIAMVLAWEMKGLLIGESATPEMEQQIAQSIASSDGVVRLIHMRTEHLGPDELLVGAKIEFAAGAERTRARRGDRRGRGPRPPGRAGGPDHVPGARRVPGAGGRGILLTTQQGSSEDTPG